jgi:methionyl-tRNA formyltransferase
VRLAVAATPSLAIPTLEWILSSEHSLDLVITRPDRKSGRGKVLQESEVGAWATSRDIAVMKPARANELSNVLTGIDLVVTIAYGVILPQEILQVPVHGFINVHFSLLPSWRGAAPVQRTIENGDTRTGITVFQLDAGMDTGPTYVFDEVAVAPMETSGELLERLSLRAPRAVEQAIEMIQRGQMPTPQPIQGASHAAKISKGEARINWNEPSAVIERKVRAFNPEPGCWTEWKGSRIGINRTRVREVPTSLSTGEIQMIENDVVVGCGSSTSLIIDEIQPAGKRAMSAREWLNGARCQMGDHFE